MKDSRTKNVKTLISKMNEQEFWRTLQLVFELPSQNIQPLKDMVRAYAENDSQPVRGSWEEDRQYFSGMFVRYPDVQHIVAEAYADESQTLQDIVETALQMGITHKMRERESREGVRSKRRADENAPHKPTYVPEVEQKKNDGLSSRRPSMR